MDASWYREKSDQNQEPVVRMELHNPRGVVKGESRASTDWKLMLFDDWGDNEKPPVAARTIVLGAATRFRSLNEALLAVVRLGADEAGHTKMRDCTVSLTFSGTETAVIEARTEKEAVSEAYYRAVQTGDLWDELKEHGKDYDLDGIDAQFVSDPIVFSIGGATDSGN